jgi:hypothetical protein
MFQTITQPRHNDGYVAQVHCPQPCYSTLRDPFPRCAGASFRDSFEGGRPSRASARTRAVGMPLGCAPTTSTL